MSSLKPSRNRSHLRNKSTIIQLLSNGYPSNSIFKSCSNIRYNKYEQKKIEINLIRKTETNLEPKIKNKEQFLENILKGKKQIKGFNENIEKEKYMKKVNIKKNSFEKYNKDYFINNNKNFNSQEIKKIEYDEFKKNKKGEIFIQKKEIELEINSPKKKIYNQSQQSFSRNLNLCKVLNKYNNSPNKLKNSNGSILSSNRKGASINFSILSSVSSEENENDSNNKNQYLENNIEQMQNNVFEGKLKREERNLLTNLILNDGSINKEISNIENLFSKEEIKENKLLEKNNNNEEEENNKIEEEEMLLKNSLKLLITPEKNFFQTPQKSKELSGCSFLNSNSKLTFKHEMNPFLIIENNIIKPEKLFHQIISEEKSSEIASPIKIISRKDTICSEEEYDDWAEVSLENEIEEFPLPSFINQINKDNFKVVCTELLNLITLDNYNIIRNKIINLTFDNNINQEKFIDILFYKAIYENKFRCLYVKLCKDLDKVLADKKNKNKSAMRNKLLDICKKNFKNIKNSIQDVNFAIGNISFISELINIQMVSKKVAVQTINNLIDKYNKFKNNENEKYLYLKCIIIILDNFGTGLMIHKDKIREHEKEIFQNEINKDINFIQNILANENNNINNILKYQLINLIEKAKNNWKPYLFEYINKININLIPKVHFKIPKKENKSNNEIENKENIIKKCKTKNSEIENSKKVKNKTVDYDKNEKEIFLGKSNHKTLEIEKKYEKKINIYPIPNLKFHYSNKFKFFSDKNDYNKNEYYEKIYNKYKNENYNYNNNNNYNKTFNIYYQNPKINNRYSKNSFHLHINHENQNLRKIKNWK